MSDWININRSTTFTSLREQSPLLQCLLRGDANIELFERLLGHGLNSTLSDEERSRLIADKLNKVMEWRKLLDAKFEGRQDDKRFCLLALGHLISAHYSGKAQSLAAIDLTLKRLANAVADKKPIIFTFCFGGYKCHTSESHPEVDWAELFSINYLVSYLYPIITGYKYGVEIEYESEEVSIQFNNVPQHLTDRYTASFKRLVVYYAKKAQSAYGLTLNLRLVIARELYAEGVSRLYTIIEEKKPAYRDIFEKLSTAEKRKWIQRAESNFMWKNGITHYGGLNDAERYEIIKEARITNEAFLEADYILRQSWFDNDYRIPLTGTWGRMPSAQPIDGWLHMKSTAASFVDCWIGTGVLEMIPGRKQQESIFSKSQLQIHSHSLTYMSNTDSELQAVSPNFARIPVLERKD